jgi:antitoxin CptB
MNKNQRTLLIKKLVYKSNNRGCKETDLVLGNFSKTYLDIMTDLELVDFDYLLSQTDADIWDWLNERSSIPDGVSKVLVENIAAKSLKGEK